MAQLSLVRRAFELRRCILALLVLGDSHTIFNFGGVAEAKIYHVPGVTMHRAARDGLASLVPSNCHPKANDILILSLGEIDSRAQVPKHARLNGRSTLEEVDALCDRFAVALSEFRKNCQATVAICCIIPFNPYTLAHQYYEDSEAASADARIIRHRMNERLKGMGAPFIDIRKAFSNPDGTLIPSKSDATLHLDPRISAPIIAELENAFGVTFTHMNPPWPNAFPRAEATKAEMRRKARKELERAIKSVFLLLPGTARLRLALKAKRANLVRTSAVQ